MYPRAVAAILGAVLALSLAACGSNLDPGDAGGGMTTAGGSTGAGGSTAYQCSGTTRSG